MGEMTRHDDPRPPRRHPLAGFRLFEGEIIIAVPGGEYMEVLNETGSRIWDLLDGSRGLKAIAAVIAEEYDVTPEDAERDVREFVEELSRRRLLEQS